ncbi:RING finger protein [Cricetulus griseus]|nr:RING finger protein [Cricetulus griseus]
MLSLCRTAALNAWDKVREPGEQLEAYAKIEQGQTEPFKDFLDRLTRAVDIQVADPAIRHSIVYTLAHDNANPMCKRILLPLKIRSAPLEEWVLHTAHIDCNMQDAGIWAEETQEVSTDSRRLEKIAIEGLGKEKHLTGAHTGTERPVLIATMTQSLK